MQQQAEIDFTNSPHLPDEAAVLSCLGMGRGAAVSSTEITRRTGLSERKIQQIIRASTTERREHGNRKRCRKYVVSNG